MIFPSARGKSWAFSMDKKITIYSVMNEPYYTLGTIWLNSLKEIMDEKINKVYIADVGLSEETKNDAPRKTPRHFSIYGTL